MREALGIRDRDREFRLVYYGQTMLLSIKSALELSFLTPVLDSVSVTGSYRVFK